MNKVKKIIIILIISLLIICIAIIGIAIHIWRNNDIEQDPFENGTPQDIEIEYPENSVKEDNDYMFFSIDDYVQQLFDYIYDSDYIAVYDLTDTEYIKNNEINSENIIDSYTNDRARMYFCAQEIYKAGNINNSIYYIYGYKICDNKVSDYYIKMKTDYNSYSFEPITINEFENAKNGKEKRIDEIKITSNDYNKFDMKNYTNKELIQKYLIDFKVKLKYFPEDAYNKIDEENKKDKFLQMEDFNKYIKENEKTINELNVFTYDMNLIEDYTEYSFTDYNNNNYKIDIRGILDYKISFLDN